MFCLILGASLPVTAQTTAADKRLPMALDSFNMQIRFVDGSKSDYQAYKTKDTWFVTDTVLYNMMEFKDLETMFMFLCMFVG